MKDGLDLDKLPLKMCSLSRCICMPNIKSLSVMAQKLWPMLKLSSNKQCDKQTNRQTDRAKTICPPDLILGALKLPSMQRVKKADYIPATLPPRDARDSEGPMNW